jgi:hypothetical protein
LGRWGLGGGEPVDFGLPNVMAARMEMQRHRRAIELCFDFVLHLAGRDEHATKVARDATSFATPEANRASPAKCRDGEALCAWRLVWTRAIGGSGPVHSYTLQPRDCSWPLTSPRLCAVPTMRASTATLVASPGSGPPRRAPRRFSGFPPFRSGHGNAIKHNRAPCREKLGFSLPAWTLSAIFRGARVRNIKKYVELVRQAPRFGVFERRTVEIPSWIGDSPVATAGRLERLVRA